MHKNYPPLTSFIAGTHSPPAAELGYAAISARPHAPIISRTGRFRLLLHSVHTPLTHADSVAALDPEAMFPRLILENALARLLIGITDVESMNLCVTMASEPASIPCRVTGFYTGNGSELFTSTALSVPPLPFSIVE